MGYLKTRYGSRIKRRPGGALGDVASYLDGLIKSVTGTAQTAVNVAGDPYLPEVICHIEQLKQIEGHQTPQVCTNTDLNLAGGIGLRNAVVPMRGYVYAQQHKWVYPVAIGVIVGLPLWIGFTLGKGR